MQTCLLGFSSQLRTAASVMFQWRHSMFWKIVPAMSLASCIGALVLNVGATMREDARLRAVLGPAELSKAFGRAMRISPLEKATSLPTDWCRDSLHVLGEEVLSKAMGDRTGDSNANSFYRAAQSGRLALSLRAADGGTCAFASNEAELLPALRRQMDSSARGWNGAVDSMVQETSDGWMSIVTIPPARRGGPMLTIGVHIMSPFAKLTRPRAILIPLASFIVITNALAALVLVILLIRRVERANHAAMTWTSGDLSTRIHDAGRDELSRLTHRFDMMADAMAGVIEVKQALAAAEERNRLARDLHDSAKQRAFALNLQLSAARHKIPTADGEGRQLIEAALSLTSQLQEDLASVIRRLAAPTIAESGFRHVLTEGVGAMLTGSDIVWSISLSDQDEALLASPPEVTRQLFLITIEAVANVLKHARCTRCTISGECAGALYTWRIKDDGVGLLPRDTTLHGMGLANMKLRAASLSGGTMETLAVPGGGTTIAVTFRLNVGQE